MGDVIATRWRKYGKDRVYVNSSDGERLGWLDLVTAEVRAEDVSRLQELLAALDGFCAAQGLPWRATATVTEQGPIAVAAQPDRPDPEPPAWDDLAAHVPGQLLREQAAVELAEMRDRSRIGTVLARAMDMKTDERAYRVGAGGEETVGARLEKLRKHGWHVLHSVPVGSRGSDIDHVLVGPGGVWTINTKNHPGGRVWVGRHAVKVNGYSQPYLRNSRFEAERAGKLLTAACGFPVEVRAALVFLTGTLFPDVTVKQAPDGVAILDRMDLPRAFKRARRCLSNDRVEAIYDLARRSTTWSSGSS